MPSWTFWGGLTLSAAACAALVSMLFTAERQAHESAARRRRVRRLVHNAFRSRKNELIDELSKFEWNMLTKKDLAVLYAHFVTLMASKDADGKDQEDGTLSREQFCAIYRSMGVLDEMVLESLFRVFDANVDGHVDFFELVHAVSVMLGGSHDDRLSIYFCAFDLNSDGFIDRREMTMAFQAMYANASREDVERSVAEFFEIGDKNHDQSISWEEFSKLGRDPRWSFEMDGAEFFFQNFLKELGIDSSAY